MSSEQETSDPPLPAPRDDRATNFGCGVGLVVAGAVMLAQQLGYIKGVDWIFPAILLGWGASYIYSALRS